MSRHAFVWLLVAVVVGVTGAARADTGLLVGVSDDAFLWRPTESAAVARDLGLTAFRITLKWDGSARVLPDDQAASLERVVEATSDYGWSSPSSGSTQAMRR